MSHQTTSDHADLLRLWFLAAGTEALEFEWCGDPGCDRCVAGEPVPVDERTPETIPEAPQVAA